MFRRALPALMPILAVGLLLSGCALTIHDHPGHAVRSYGFQRIDANDGYAEAIVVPAGMDLVVLSGQVGLRPDGSVPATVEEQMELAFATIRRRLEQQGLTAKDVFRITTYVVERPTDSKRFWQPWNDYFVPGSEPGSTFLYVPRLIRPEYKVEIDIWAARAPKKPAR